ncbi:hypothetical protein GCM10025771_02260 [Niveibacterium umoris]|uniref:hypothetical protein n=1 Tax=Niveibacterium umoris TaxID=1193620 RepID=UPI00160D8828|nr:hypothetical protein [Niveibacterium umoris]
MTISSSAWLTVALLMLGGGKALAEPADGSGVATIAVVVRADSSLRAMTRDELYAMFVLDQRGPYNPIDLPESDPTRTALYLRLASKNLTMMRALRARLVFTGAGRPPQQLELPAALARLAADQAAVVYLPAGKIPVGARVVATLGSEP